MSKAKAGLFRTFRLRTLWRSPCEKLRLTQPENPYPCLSKNWNNPRCPVCSAIPDSIRSMENRMYRAGYAHGAWVVRQDKLGLAPLCSLVFFKDELNEATMRERFGKRFIRFTPITPLKPKKKP